VADRLAPNLRIPPPPPLFTDIPDLDKVSFYPFFPFEVETRRRFPTCSGLGPRQVLDHRVTFSSTSLRTGRGMYVSPSLGLLQMKERFLDPLVIVVVCYPPACSLSCDMSSLKSQWWLSFFFFFFFFFLDFLRWGTSPPHESSGAFLSLPDIPRFAPLPRLRSMLRQLPGLHFPSCRRVRMSPLPSSMARLFCPLATSEESSPVPCFALSAFPRRS